MKKPKTVFLCNECGYESPKWMGQCICGAWNTMTEEKVIDFEEDDKRRIVAKEKSNAIKLKDVKSGSFQRIDTGIGELNRVLGGGLVKGSLTLISGEPGVGKSTIILQAAALIAKKCGKVLYVTGEESEEQVKMRADRVCGEQDESLYILAETNIEAIIQNAEAMEPTFLIVDSIQTMYSGDLTSASGTVSQVRTCASEIMRYAKTNDVPVFLVAHITKNGELAGPKIVEHLVDCVLYFTGERNQDLRIIRSYKNRFGTTNEIGAFEMREEGLTEVANLSESFLEGLENEPEGAVATGVYEGTRPLLLEIQALTCETKIGFAARTTVGIDKGRLNMIIAVLSKKAQIPLFNHDIYINVVGGIRPEGTSCDLAVALAIVSSIKAIKSSAKTLAVGEIGLTGDLRSVQNIDKIVNEAIRMGFNKILLPYKNAEKIKKDFKNIQICGAKNLTDAVYLFENLDKG